MQNSWLRKQKQGRNNETMTVTNTDMWQEKSCDELATLYQKGLQPDGQNEEKSTDMTMPPLKGRLPKVQESQDWIRESRGWGRSPTQKERESSITPPAHIPPNPLNIGSPCHGNVQRGTYGLCRLGHNQGIEMVERAWPEGISERFFLLLYVFQVDLVIIAFLS